MNKPMIRFSAPRLQSGQPSGSRERTRKYTSTQSSPYFCMRTRLTELVIVQRDPSLWHCDVNFLNPAQQSNGALFTLDFSRTKYVQSSVWPIFFKLILIRDNVDVDRLRKRVSCYEVSKL